MRLSFFALILPCIAHAAISEPVSYRKVKDWLKGHPGNATLEDLLPELPESYRGSFTLMHDTKSLQNATPDEPRVIFYGPDAKFLMAFDGNGRSLEMIEWQPATASFEFHEITFRTGAGQPHFSAANPGKCVRCHGPDLRPNWEHYRRWPGAYGEDDDSFQESPNALKEALARVIAKAPTHPLYRHLVQLAEGYASYGYRTAGARNNIFTERLQQLNFQRVIRLLRQRPEYERLKYALLGAMFCENVRIPGAGGWHDRWNRRVAALGDDASHCDRLLDVLTQLGISTERWTTDFRAAIPSFTTPGAPTQEFVAIWGRRDPQIGVLLKYDPYNHDGPELEVASPDVDCARLGAQ